MNKEILDYSKWRKRLPELKKKYSNNQPYPHIVMDDFLEKKIIGKLVEEFPKPDSGDWINYKHVNEKKLGKNKRESMPPTILKVIDELNSDRFVEFLSELTGIKNLFSDSKLEGGGIHQSEKGGFLNVHADFTVHPHNRDWRRRCNILIYLNPGWKEEWGGHIELWDKKMNKCVTKAAPFLNRCLIFNTEKDSFHGHPEPLKCPETESRKSIALYYYTKEDNPLVQSTDYRSRPGEGFVKGTLVYLDKMAVRIYDFAKRKLGISDEFASKVLGYLSKKKK